MWVLFTGGSVIIPTLPHHIALLVLEPRRHGGSLSTDVSISGPPVMVIAEGPGGTAHLVGRMPVEFRI